MDLVYGLQLVFVNKISPEYGHICLPVANGCFHAKVAKTSWSTKSRTLTICACKKTAELKTKISFGTVDKYGLLEFFGSYP